MVANLFAQRVAREAEQSTRLCNIALAAGESVLKQGPLDRQHHHIVQRMRLLISKLCEVEIKRIDQGTLEARTLARGRLWALSRPSGFTH
jgi:hypothetical protein